MANQPTPGAVANTLVRNILTKAGLMAGGLSNEQWQQTLDAFDGCCAYTGTSLQGIAPEKEHAVPMNRTLGGLHVFGNVLPSTAEANRQKGGLPYNVFLRSKGAKFSSLAHLTDEQRENAIERISDFIQNSRTDGLLAAHPELLAFYEAQYQNAKNLCATAAQELEELLQRLNVADSPNTDEADDTTLDLPSNEQFELEERDTDNLPEAYQKIQEGGNEMKVGAYARAVFEQLFVDGRIAAFLPNLTYREDSFYDFKLSFPALVTQRQTDPIHYYASPYRYNGTEYYLCSQWYERNRDCLDSWLTETVFSQSV